jgi:putative protease
MVAQHDLQNGDGLCFFTRERELGGFRIDRVDKEKIYPGSMKGLRIGTVLYRNYDIGLARILKKGSARRSITVTMDFLQDDASVRVRVEDEDGNRAEVQREVPFEPTRDPVLAREQTAKHLSSTGNTPYRVAGLTVRPDEPGFLPVSALNRLRREVLEALTEIRVERYPRQSMKVTPNGAPYPEEKLDFHANVLNRYARLFYERHGAEVTEAAFETLSKVVGRTVMTTRYCIRHHLDMCGKHHRSCGKHHQSCGKYGESARPAKEPWRLSDRHHSYRLEFDCKKCEMHVIMER